MLVKRIGAIALALSCFCSIAQADVSFNATKFAVDVDVHVSQNAGESVIVSVADASTGAISESNLPCYIYPHFTNANGAIVASIPLSKGIASGRYNVTLSNSSIKDVYTIAIINENDEATKEILAQINSSKNADEIYKLLTTDNNAIKVGIDLSDASISSNLNYAVSFIINRRGNKTYTVDTLQTAISLGLMCCDITNGRDIDEVMEQNATLFGTTYESYSALDDKTRSIVKSILSKADYINNDATDIYTSALDVANVRSAKSWAALQEYLLENAERIGISLNSGDYAKIKDSNRYKVYQAMFKNISNYNNYQDIVDDFNKQAKSVKNAQESSSKPSGGGGGGGGGGGSANATTSVVAPTGVSSDASKEDTIIAWLLTPFTITDVAAVKAMLMEYIK